ncbi:MAG: HAD-IA family hydrolase [Thermoleophilia bacterium]
MGDSLKNGGAYRAVLLDLDGVITRTAHIHAQAWQRMFDSFLKQWSEREGKAQAPFDIEADYRRYVDGKPRYDGVRSFLRSRSIDLPEGIPDDPPGIETDCGLGNRKDEIFLELLRDIGVKTYPDTIEQIRRWREQGMKTAVITSSRNGEAILEAAGLRDLFDVKIDGVDATGLGIRGKPAPDTFLEAARRLDVEPREAIVVEDAISGVEAGRSGGFGLVVGVVRGGSREGKALLDKGADVAVEDLRDVDALSSAPNRLRREEGGMGREMREWELIYRDWNPAEQGLREALCALGNGRIVTRGAFEEADAGGPHYPGTYLAGGYNRLETVIDEHVLENEDLVNWPNWLPLTFRAEGGDWFSLDAVEVLDFSYRLDVYQGTLERKLRFRDVQDREFSLLSLRMVHMASPHLAAIEWTLTPHNWSGNVEIRSALDGSVVNANVRRYDDLNKHHLEVSGTGYDSDDVIYLTAHTRQSFIRMAQAARTRVFDDEDCLPIRREREENNGYVAQLLTVPCRRHKRLRVEKIVAIHTSRDFAVTDPETAARKAVRRAGSFGELLGTHERKWRHLWNISDIDLSDGDIESQLILRLHIFHLLQSVSANTIDFDVGVPSRGWHGEAYRGHIFWDELFIFPFLTLRIPELTRSLLMYRYHRLDEARHLSRGFGYEGALFPWQSGSDGREESQVLHLNPLSGRWVSDHSNLQWHVNAAIAYNFWQYYQATGDMEFLSYYGAEMLVEIARFWASIATYHTDRKRFEIRGVVGPDEFHTGYPDSDEPGLDNNAYTNVMAAWTLRCTCSMLELLDDERRRNLMEELEVADEEIVRWNEISRNLFIPLHDGIISQFEGYEKLKEFDWDGYREKYGNIQRIDRLLEAEGDDANRYKASKQADVLMLFYLFSADELKDLFDHMGYGFDPGFIPRNIDYYISRTSHGSTLSQIIHTWVLARANRREDWPRFHDALRSDIDDNQRGTTSEGIHLGAMACTVDLILRGHTGLEMRDDVLWFDPLLPRELSNVRLRIRYRGHWLSVSITQHKLTVSFDRGLSPAVSIGYRGEVHEVAQGETRSFTR